MGKPTVYHAAIVLFLEFFAFGLLAIPMLDVGDITLLLIKLSLCNFLFCQVHLFFRQNSNEKMISIFF